jgi:hypothetical protein
VTCLDYYETFIGLYYIYIVLMCPMEILDIMLIISKLSKYIFGFCC